MGEQTKTAADVRAEAEALRGTLDQRKADVAAGKRKAAGLLGRQYDDALLAAADGDKAAEARVKELQAEGVAAAGAVSRGEALVSATERRIAELEAEAARLGTREQFNTVPSKADRKSQLAEMEPRIVASIEARKDGRVTLTHPEEEVRLEQRAFDIAKTRNISAKKAWQIVVAEDLDGVERVHARDRAASARVAPAIVRA